MTKRLIIFLLALCLVWQPSYSQTQLFSGSSSSGGNTPVFVQGTGSDLNDNNGITGNNYVVNLPNSTGAGNAIVLSFSYPFSSGRTFAISDICGDTWPSATITTGTASTGNMNAKTYVLANASSCLHILTITFDAEIKPFQYTIAEFQNINTVSPTDGSHGAVNVNTTSDAGSYTPNTNNDGNGGHLIWNYAISNDTVGTTSSTQATAIGLRGGISPARMHANNISTIPSASSYDIQSINGAINPGFNFTQSSGTNFVIQSVALKAANAGTAPSAGIRIKRLLHFTVSNPINGNNILLFPADGNLLVATMAAGNNLNAVNSVSDSNSQSYTGVSAAGTSQVFYHQNSTSGNTLTLTVNQTGPQFSIHLWDVVGAQVSSFLNAQSFNGSAPNSGDIVDCPAITPNAAPGLVINQTGSGTASQSAMATGSPLGSVFDTISYTTSAPLFDQDRIDNADQFAHTNFSTTTIQHWNFTMTGTSQHGSTLFATAAAFK